MPNNKVQCRVVKKTKKTIKMVSVNLIHHPHVDTFVEAEAIEALVAMKHSSSWEHTESSCGSCASN